MSQLLLVIIISIIILITISYSYYCFKHSFWSKQPVSNWFYFNIKDTVITTKLPIKLKIPNKFYIQNYSNTIFFGKLP